MKHTNLFLLSSLIASATTGAHASHVYANAVTAHNIAGIQHAITHTAFNSFEGVLSSSLDTQLNNTEKQDARNHKQMYGRAATYGEYEEYSTGRNGGDTSNSDAALNSIWFSWEHIDNDIKFDDFDTIDSDFDLVMMGLSGGQSKMGDGITRWGIYTGYIGGGQENDFFDINEQGGYFGLYNGFYFGNFNLSTSVNGGALDNAADTTYGTDDFTNFWVGATLNATYNFALDDTFTIQPGVQLGYTWIKSENYTSASGDIIANDAFNMIEVSPTLRAIKHIGNGWHGGLNIKHVMIYANGGDLSVNDERISELDLDGFTEYGLTLEKSVSNIIFTANFGRRDGSHNGWIGGTNIKIKF